VDGVLEEMDKQVSGEDEKSGVPPRRWMLSGTISTSAVASMKPAPSATK